MRLWFIDFYFNNQTGKAIDKELVTSTLTRFEIDVAKMVERRNA